ncbi:MAG TPA: type II toxin-antitoxin system HicB family antitoxin [Candidatus Elarobacter sp.]|nr:type II toxin-antitoxin system HicB family antitoxin [Candidatus Elarobacter sp.]HEV2740593.1 type II toxin-antitoxin system HicB family antitoxin [Candidatus Elarobacter sp.]
MADPAAYRVILEPDENTLRCFIPAFPSIYTFGVDRDDALWMAKDAILLEIEHAAENGLPIPEPDADSLMLIERVTIEPAT